jgi:hypothetical protein
MRNNSRERGLAGTGRTPENKRRHRVRTQSFSEKCTGADKLGLSQEFIKIFGAHPIGEGRGILYHMALSYHSLCKKNIVWYNGNISDKKRKPMGIKDFFVKKMMESKLKNVPEARRGQIIELVTKNPELFEKIGKEIQQKTKEGKSEMAASMEVMRKYQSEIQKAMGR